MQRILIVRMSALGDIVHALPVLAAIRRAHPDADIDWLVDARYAGVLEFVSGVTTVITGRPRLVKAIGRLRQRGYDCAIDLQGLLKSAVMARLSGARRVIGFERAALRERGAAWFYSQHAPVGGGRPHVIRRNLAVLPLIGVETPTAFEFPLVVPHSSTADALVDVATAGGSGGFALMSPGAGWPNKRWQPSRFGRVAAEVRARHGLRTVVLWGAGEAALADAVVSASDGAAIRAPLTTLGDVLALCARARLMIAGDTGPLHLAAAIGTAVVGLFGPTWPDRNGPWRDEDVVASRAAQCACHHKRRCQRDGRSGPVESRMCLNDIPVDEVVAAVERRLSRVGPP